MKVNGQIIRLNMCYHKQSKRISNTPYSILISFNIKKNIHITMLIKHYIIGTHRSVFLFVQTFITFTTKDLTFSLLGFNLGYSAFILLKLCIL